MKKLTDSYGNAFDINAVRNAEMVEGLGKRWKGYKNNSDSTKEAGDLYEKKD